MCKLISISLLLCFPLLKISGQVVFEKGYFVNENGIRTECFIKNNGWDSNPSNFQYKIQKNSEKKIANISAIKEFGIYKTVKFIRANVEMDNSLTILSQMSEDEAPYFEERLVFLRVLQDGTANLYSYSDTNLVKYFFSTSEISITQLIYKPYLTYKNDVKVVAYNRVYKTQLGELFSGSCVNLESITEVDYTEEHLMEIFSVYNSCNENSYSYTQRFSKQDFNLSVRAGINFNNLTLRESLTFSERETKLSGKASFRFGVELEYVFPFGKNKYSAFFEPSYQTYQNNESVEGFSYEVDYRALDFPIGIRYSGYLSEDCNIFFNIGYLVGFDLGSNFETRQNVNFEIPKREIAIGNRNSAIFGIGFEYYRHSMEFRYYLKSNILDDEDWDSDFQTFGFIYGFRVF